MSGGGRTRGAAPGQPGAQGRRTSCLCQAAQEHSGTTRTGRSWVSEGAQAAEEEEAAPQGSQPAPGCDSARYGQLASYVNPLMVNLERGNGKADLPNSCQAPGASEMIPPEAPDAALSAQVGQAGPGGLVPCPPITALPK